MDTQEPFAKAGPARSSNGRSSQAPSMGAAEAPVPRWASDQLLGSRKEVEISHAGAVYRLRVTALGKLILTK